MKTAGLPGNETERLYDLLEYKIMDTPPEVEFDDLVQLAAKIARVPMSLIALIDENRQWFKSKIGINLDETPRELSFCSHTILGNSLLIVKDARDDERFCDNPFVTGTDGIRFYAGVPLISYRGHSIGTLCVLDTVPGDLDEDQRLALHILGQQVIKQFELKRLNENLELINKMQGRLMGMLLRDIKSPLAATGTFLNLLQTNGQVGLNVLKYSNVTSRQFNVTLSLLDTVMEWGRLFIAKKETTQMTIHTDLFIAGLITDLKKLAYSSGYSLVNKSPDAAIEVRFPRELYFVIHSSILWLFDCADTGDIIIEELSSYSQRIVIRIKFVAPLFSQTVIQSIDKLNSGSLWHNNPNVALEGVTFRLAKDMVIARNGTFMASYDEVGAIDINIQIDSNGA